MTSTPQGSPGGIPLTRWSQRATWASMVGAVADWYDYFLYGTAAALVLGKLYFPGSVANGTLAAFATFAVGFFFRPVGSAVFGHFGDRIGRKRMLSLTLLLMGGASTLIGVLPTYSQIGMAAPALLVLLRAVQGFAVGGEWGGAVLLAVETSPQGQRALRGSVVQTGAFIGLVLADGVYLILTYTMSAHAFDTWGWRVPFLISVVILTLGYWVRRGVLETPLFEQVKKKGRLHKLPLWSALKTHPAAFFTIIGMYIGPNVVTYIVLTFAISYAKNRAGVSDNAMLMASMIAAGGSLITIPLAARWGDRRGYVRVYVVGAIVAIAFAFPFIWSLDSGNILAIVLTALVLVAVGDATMVAVQQPIFADLFDIEFRYSGAGFSYGVGAALGGVSPFIATLLVQAGGGSGTYPAIYLIGIVAVSLTTTVLVRQRIRLDRATAELPQAEPALGEAWVGAPDNAPRVSPAVSGSEPAIRSQEDRSA
jgi:MFS transporter, MHS family, shikimate and dehydroshikimate transport protein